MRHDGRHQRTTPSAPRAEAREHGDFYVRHMTTSANDDHTTIQLKQSHDPSPAASPTPSTVLAAAAVGGVALGLTNLLAAWVLPYPLGGLGGSHLGWALVALVTVYVVAPRLEAPHRDHVRTAGLVVLALTVALMGLDVVAVLVSGLGQGLALLDPTSILGALS